MLAPSGRGRKAHLLEDKQIPSVGVFDEIQLRLLSDIVIKINYLLTAYALLSLCFAFAAADEDLSPLAVEDLHQQKINSLMII
ncbi:hypothetical protein Tco_1081723 [Tanacetum coccineum]|uniref:Uncharacterized protein n=1 Tax=Tanacetum coccineum TaxID=301880 RepID=A0ABQ5HYE2_9ASTR